MSEAKALTGPERAPESGAKAKQLVVLLHGWGADGEDLIGLAPFLAQALPDAHFIAPNGPYPCEANPAGRQWFGIMDISMEERFAGVQEAAKLIDPFLDAKLAEFGLGEESLALVGFSQGTMLSLQVALRRPKQMAQVVGFSGLLLGEEVLEAEIAARPPVLLVHGQDDEMLPIAASQQAYLKLKSLDVPAYFIPRPNLGHSIDEIGIHAAAAALFRAFAA